MRETQFTGHLAKTLREKLFGCVVFKHTDDFTSGVPDLSVTWGGATIWLEAKIQSHSSVGSRISGKLLQLETMRRLERCSSLAFYVVLDPETNFVYLYSPDEVHDTGALGQYILEARSQVEIVDFLRRHILARRKP